MVSVASVAAAVSDHHLPYDGRQFIVGVSMARIMNGK